jgi:hypothetical protein
MPPWHAEGTHGTFLNDRRLSDGDKDTILRWVEGGSPKGNPEDLPSLPTFAEGWEIGQPDLVISIPKSYEVPAQGTIAYQNFTVPTNFTEDRWVQAIEARPGNRSVVHHILVYAISPQNAADVPGFTQVVPARPVAAGRGGAGSPGVLIATTAPGTNAMVFQPGTAMLIRAGSTLRFQMHYTAAGKPATDLSSVGIIFAKEAPKTAIRVDAFMNTQLRLPAGSQDTVVDTAIEFTADSHISAIFPHTHLRGKGWEYRLVYPDGHKEVVLAVPSYDFNWQTYYLFASPLAMPRGTRIEASAWYDNSPRNAANPDPTRLVRWGEQTWDVMQYTGITYTVDGASGATTGR